ncbi:glucose 1-dehydrogenase [Microbacterium sp. K24]|uniref:SDR family NAD(P)-dependent oxidoreductase n=1 Tax=Microbacterium sp. K24 TaxID=2305446 RepID=UPI00197B68BB|nr:glucose 1-dehydrogenase [Microbacterium sp. K24]
MTNKRVLVTGGAQGIGFAVAKRFVEEGATVTITDIAQQDKIDESVRALEAPGRAFGVRLDVTDEGAISRVFADAAERMDGFDVLVNNAGINIGSPTEDLDSATYDRVMDVNLRGVFLCSTAALRIFLAAGRGVIVNNSSNHEMTPKPGYLPYSVSKGGLGNLTRTLALEFADRNIRVNSVGPGATVTPLNASWTEDPTKRAEVEKHIPFGRAGTADEVAAAFVFLASDDASYITGQTLYADGGLTLNNDFRFNWSS